MPLIGLQETMALYFEGVRRRFVSSGSGESGSTSSAVPALGNQVPSGAAILPGRIKDLLVLTKARANMAVVTTAVVGFALHADVGSNFPLVLHLVIGTTLLAGGASMANQAIEHDLDSNMTRTRNRPIASGRLNRGAGFLLSALFCTVGCLCLATGVNLNAMMLGLLAFVVYVGIYTPMKRLSPVCTLAGAVSGALPLLVGWAAAGAEFGLWAAVTFGVLYLWQIPHFMAIAWWRRAEYLGAGYRVLSRNDAGGFRTAALALASTLGVTVVSLIPAFTRHVGSAYAAGAIALGLLFSVFAIRFCVARSVREARALFLASLFYLPSVFALMLVCQIRE